MRGQDLGVDFEVEEVKVKGADVKCPRARVTR